MSPGSCGADVAHLGLHLTVKPNNVVKADCRGRERLPTILFSK